MTEESLQSGGYRLMNENVADVEDPGGRPDEE